MRSTPLNVLKAVEITPMNMAGNQTGSERTSKNPSWTAGNTLLGTECRIHEGQSAVYTTWLFRNFLIEWILASRCLKLSKYLDNLKAIRIEACPGLKRRGQSVLFCLLFFSRIKEHFSVTKENQLSVAPGTNLLFVAFSAVLFEFFGGETCSSISPTYKPHINKYED